MGYDLQGCFQEELWSPRELRKSNAIKNFGKMAKICWKCVSKRNDGLSKSVIILESYISHLVSKKT